ncbi:MAG: DMT family transporter [Rhodospirillaceae bacterium]
MITRNTWIGIGSGAAAGALWGLVFLAPEVTRDFNPLQLAVARYTTYGLISALLIAPRWRAIVATLGFHEWRALLWMSFVGNIVYFFLLGTAVQLGGVAMTSVVIGFLPITVTLIGTRDHGAVPLRRLSPALVLGTIGIVCISIETPPSAAARDEATRLIGVAAALGALACWTAFAVANSRWLARVQHISGHDWNLLGGVTTGSLALIFLGPAFLLAPAIHATEDWIRFLVTAAGIALTASIIGNMFWNIASRYLPLTLIGQMILFETLFALLYGFLWERRPPTTLEATAIVLLVTSVILCVRAHRPAPVHPETA